MKELERATVLRAGPILATWIFFFSIPFIKGDLSRVFLAPVVLPFLGAGLIFSVLLYGTRLRSGSVIDGKRLAVACQISIFLLHYVLQQYATFEPWLEYLLLAMYLIYALRVSLRFSEVNAFSGPALLAAGLDHTMGGPTSLLYAFPVFILLLTLHLGVKDRRIRNLVTRPWPPSS